MLARLWSCGRDHKREAALANFTPRLRGCLLPDAASERRAAAGRDPLVNALRRTGKHSRTRDAANRNKTRLTAFSHA